jgi:tetratricopeptide (TPR) repeat protein
MNQLQTLRPSDRRLLFALAAATLFLLATLIWRLLGGSAAPPPDGPARSFSPPTTAETVSQWRARLEDAPDAGVYAALGLALLQQVRETGDPGLYGQAETALNEALALDPEQLDALVGQGLLALARHDFAAALTWGEQVRDLMPYRADALGILVDGHIELGQYDQAIAAAQAMVNLRPDLASYSRVAYVRELHGDTPGAIEAMRAAAEAAPPTGEATAWTLVQLGHLYFNSGDVAGATAAYDQALRAVVDYPYALAGLARAQAARGDLPGATAAYERVAARLPLPEFVIALGALYESAGRADEAAAQYDLVRAMQQLNAAAGMNTDLEMALFEANHGDPAAALAMAEAAYARRPTIYAEDTLAWANYRNGRYDEAQRLSERALRLNTQDATLYFHAGMIAAARGDTAAAVTHLRHALDLNPHFDLLHAPQAAATLATLQGE